jgi:hypothetical protein
VPEPNGGGGCAPFGGFSGALCRALGQPAGRAEIAPIITTLRTLFRTLTTTPGASPVHARSIPGRKGLRSRSCPTLGV